MSSLAEAKAEIVEEINDMLDSLSPAESRKILYKLTYADLIVLNRAIKKYGEGE